VSPSEVALQLAMEFPKNPYELESFWIRLGAIQPAAPQSPEPPPAPVEMKNDAQQIIWQTEESVALRFSFRVPVYTKKGMLKDWGLKLVSKSNLVSAEDFGILFDYNANKLADEFKVGVRAAVIKKLGLTEEQGELVEFRGISVARHLAGTKVEINDARWV
jgi:hypothetical protein